MGLRKSQVFCVALFALVLVSGCTSPPAANQEKVWVELEPVQCRGNPWEHQDREFPSEIDAIQGYYLSRGVKIYGHEYVERALNACSGCSCPRGDKYRLLVEQKDSEKISFWPVQGTNQQPEFFAIRASPETIESGAELLVSIRNNSVKPVYFGGCNDYLVESLVEGEWQEAKKFEKQCVWEGLPRKIGGQEALQLVADGIDLPGRHRLKFQLGLDCEENKPLSQARCRILVQAYSNEFTVNPLPAVAEQQLRACAGDGDCVRVSEGCCDCLHSGRNTAINAKYKDYWSRKLEADCQAVRCLAALSAEDSCREEFIPACVEGRCAMAKKATAGKQPVSAYFRRIDAGPYSLGGNQVETAKDALQWQTLWENAHAQLKPAPKLPPIDFEKYRVVGIFIGKLTHDFYSITVERAEELDDEIVVYYSKQAATAIELRDTTHFAPYALIELLKTDKPITLKESVAGGGEKAQGLRQGE